jgi:hypothetical protein
MVYHGNACAYGYRATQPWTSSTSCRTALIKVQLKTFKLLLYENSSLFLAVPSDYATMRGVLARDSQVPVRPWPVRLHNTSSCINRRKDRRHARICAFAKGFGAADDAAKIKVDWRERSGKKQTSESVRRRKRTKREDDPNASLVRRGPTRIAKVSHSCMQRCCSYLHMMAFSSKTATTEEYSYLFHVVMAQPKQSTVSTYDLLRLQIGH